MIHKEFDIGHDLRTTEFEVDAPMKPNEKIGPVFLFSYFPTVRSDEVAATRSSLPESANRAAESCVIPGCCSPDRAFGQTTYRPVMPMRLRPQMA